MIEEWRPVESGFYSVSNLGRVRREAPARGTYPGNMLSSKGSRGFYPSVAIHRSGFRGRRRIHDLVTEAFLGPKPSGMYVNHKDGDKTNNRLDNLEYVTPSENAQHAIRSGLNAPPAGQPGSSNHNAKLTEADIPVIRGRVAAGETHAAVAADYAVSESLVALVAKRRAWRHVA